MRASQHFLYRWPLPGSGFLKINSLLFNDCYILLSRNILAADFYWQRHFLKSILHLGISEVPKFKICTYAKGLLYTCSIREKAESHQIYLPDPVLTHATPLYVGIFSANCCRSPGTAFSARSDSLEIPWSVYFPRHNYRLLAVLALHPYTQMCVTVLCKC